ncbi:unnamed protein product [Rangifer tarandus platyrhynchus]|uniref:Uncharacterized protein n=1 Tax=Rangifer tarandus platyrhynchus TaxID=3082113 RepID=A0AC59Z741_RANTA
MSTTRPAAGGGGYSANDGGSRAGPPRPVARRTPWPHLLPRGPELTPQRAHPRQGCQGAKQECLSNSEEVLPPHRTLRDFYFLLVNQDVNQH